MGRGDLVSPAPAMVCETDVDFVDEALAESFRKHDLLAMALDRPSGNEEGITLASDGPQELLETTKTPVRHELGQAMGVLGIRHDITQRLALLDSLTATIRASAGSHFEPAMVQAFDAVLDKMCQTKADWDSKEQQASW